MAMALAVALVACSGAAGTTGPAGPKGDTGEPGRDAPTPDPTDPSAPQPGDSPVATIMRTHTLRFNDAADGAYDPKPKMVDVNKFFHPGTGLEYMVEDLSAAEAKLLDAQASEDGMLTVMFKKADAGYGNHMFNVKATAANETSDTSTITVRRNRSPMIKSTGTRDGTTIGEPDATAIWVTEKEMSVPVHNVNATGDAPTPHIPIVIGALKAPGADSEHAQMPYFFLDDVGNKLSLVSDLSVGDTKTLMVVDGEMKVTLTGLKSTHKVSTTVDHHMPVNLMVSAIDDGGLVSDNEEHVLTIHIDTAPTTKGRIGTKVITLGTTDLDRVGVPGVAEYFEDDRDAEFDFFVWSDDPAIASVSINSQNKDDDAVTLDITSGGPIEGGFYVEGKGRGTAMIMVKAQEMSTEVTDFGTLVNDTPGSAGGKQSVTLTFIVEVK